MDKPLIHANPRPKKAPAKLAELAHMKTHKLPVLDRNNPDNATLAGNTKVTRNDWLNLARDILVNEGEAEIKILQMADRLGVSRSSFYWYFGNRTDLLDALLNEWSVRNTTHIVAHCQRYTRNATDAVCNFLQCFMNPDIFDTGLDFAIREWARRDPALRSRIDAADQTRIEAMKAMYMDHGYDEVDADTRGRILYFMQLGYYTLKQSEPMAERMSRIVPDLRALLGHDPDPIALAAFRSYLSDTKLI